MATIYREILIAAHPDTAWSALRDVGALHTRLAPGFVVDTQLGDGERLVTFANGMAVRELIVDIDDTLRRVAWSVVGSPMTHHNGAAQIVPSGNAQCRFVWVADLLPDSLAPDIDAMMAEGLTVIKEALEGTAHARESPS